MVSMEAAFGPRLVCALGLRHWAKGQVCDHDLSDINA